MGRLYIRNCIWYIISLFLWGENILGNRYDILSPYFCRKIYYVFIKYIISLIALVTSGAGQLSMLSGVFFSSGDALLEVGAAVSHSHIAFFGEMLNAIFAIIKVSYIAYLYIPSAIGLVCYYSPSFHEWVASKLFHFGFLSGLPAPFIIAIIA